jgi:hypothetical protein
MGFAVGDRVLIVGSRMLGGRKGTIVKRRRLLFRRGWLVDLDRPHTWGVKRTTVAEVALQKLPIE